MYTFCLIVIVLALFLTVLNSQSGEILQKKKPILENVHYLTVEVMPGTNSSNLIFKNAPPKQKESPLPRDLKKKASKPVGQKDLSALENPAGKPSDEIPPVQS